MTTLKEFFVELLQALFTKGFIVKMDPTQEDMPSTDNIVVATVMPPEVPKQPPTGSNPMLTTFCTAIRDYEGSPGNLNYKNNNPGNTRCSAVGYLPKYGHVTCVNNFAVFESYDLGWEYLQNLVIYRAELHPDWTIGDFFRNYAPSGDNNNPSKYAEFVATRCGVSTATTLRSLLG